MCRSISYRWLATGIREYTSNKREKIGVEIMICDEEMRVTKYSKIKRGRKALTMDNIPRVNLQLEDRQTELTARILPRSSSRTTAPNARQDSYNPTYDLSVTLCNSRLDERTKVAFVARLEFGEDPIIACDGVPAERGAATTWPFEQGYRLGCLEGVVHC